ncbi:MAG: tocopherol cyclase family protein [bacterium]
MINKLKAILNPEEFQGRGKKHTYFEGWYFKVLNASETKAYAFIPGVALDELGNRQAFIQLLDGKNLLSHYYKFDFQSFVAAKGKFEISIEENHFSKDSITLHLPSIKGSLRFENRVPWPTHWYSPGIMGPYSFVPFMECYHGIVSLDHTVYGQLELENETIDFDNGRGYIEKDWGHSFPTAYVWMQSNHFTNPGVSLKASVAKIPWLGNSFVGFIVGIWIYDRLISFTTYNKSSLLKLNIDSSRIELILENKDYSLEILVLRDAATSLVSPIRGFMDGRIEESMSSSIEVAVTDKKSGLVIFQDCGRNASIEVAGNISEILHPHN